MGIHILLRNEILEVLGSFSRSLERRIQTSRFVLGLPVSNNVNWLERDGFPEAYGYYTYADFRERHVRDHILVFNHSRQLQESSLNVLIGQIQKPTKIVTRWLVAQFQSCGTRLFTFAFGS